MMDSPETPEEKLTIEQCFLRDIARLDQIDAGIQECKEVAKEIIATQQTQLKELQSRLEQLQKEAQAAVNSLTRQRNQLSDQITQLEIQLTLKGP